MIIDTHCHLNFPDYNADRDAVMKRAADAGVAGCIVVGTGPHEWQRTLDLAEGHPALRVALGVHPNEAAVFSDSVAAQLKQLASSDSRTVAIGETGLDFYRDNAPREKQFESFRYHLALSLELNKPFILHCRAAEAEMIEVLAEFQRSSGASLRGVWHCFTSTPEFAAKASALDLYFGLGGIVTYPKANEVRAAVAALPAERILLETDCPFLPPQGWRGQRNEPSYLSKVVEILAEVRKTSRDEIERQTTENARRLFGSWY
ncbi:MAG TPA: TatD family hydrolase [Planctomycetota bacterium]|nr:TatD family hydrolase [Planctomycetota bacterium]